MDYQEFIRTVRSRGGFASQERAEKLTATTLETIGEIVPNADKRKLIEQLPAELRSAFERPTSVPAYSLDEFFNRIAAREGTTFEDARRDVLIVISVLRDAMAGREIDELWAQLPGEYRRILNPGAPPASTL
ncbi:MAG: DUF2267 domain-containing protein [Sulfurifustaceae bacterium]